MYIVDMYLRVRRACLVEGMSIREASRVFGLHRDTVRKMLSHPVPPGYRRKRPPHRPKLEPYTGVIDRILEDDLSAPKKQRHTAKRIFERLKKEHGFDGGYTIVKDYVRERRRVVREMFVPLSHPPGHAQCDFGQAWAFIGGKRRRIHYFVMSLPHSDGIFIKAYPAETTEAFCDGHVSAFAFLGGVPQSILYDNSKIAVAKILGGGRRKRTRAFTELQSHYLFSDRFGRVGKGNDKGSVEGMVGYGRRNFLVPIPRAESFDELNAHLESECMERMDARLRGHTESIGERMERDLGALLALPAVPYDASDKHATRVSSQSLVRYRTNDYSVPVAFGHRDVLVRGYVDEVVISCGTDVIARHRRSYEHDDFVFRRIGLESTQTPGVSETLRGLSRQLGVSQKQARPLDADALAAIRATALNPRKARGGSLEMEDTALRRGRHSHRQQRHAHRWTSHWHPFCLTRACASRRLASLRWRDVLDAENGAGLVYIERSKTDQAG